jgi:hypothetical protein
MFCLLRMRSIPLVAEVEGVAAAQPLVRLAVLVQVGRRHEAAAVLAAQHHHLALTHPAHCISNIRTHSTGVGDP